MLFRSKTVKSFKWAELKSNLEVVDDVIVDKATGEVVEIPGVSIVEKAEEVQVK